MKGYRTALLCLALLVAGLALRLPGLGASITPDENLWASRTAQFFSAFSQGDWAGTTTSGHPGVTTTYAGSAGLLLKWVLDRPPQAATVGDLARTLADQPANLDFLPWLRLPVALACALGVVLIFLLARRLLGEPVALFGAAFLTFDPFFLAHSRLLHLDALVTTAITIAWLALLLATRTGRRRYYLTAGLALGLGILTKSPALALGPLAAGWVLLAGWRARRSARLVLADLLWLGIPALICIVALWPAMWVGPVQTVGRVLGLMATYGQTEHELGNFWLGRAQGNPGWLFYPVALLLRTTPVTLAGSGLAAAFWLWRTFRSPHDRRETGGWSVVGALLLLLAWYTAILTDGDKKFDRYLLPVFPGLDLLAAWGWLEAARWLAQLRARGLPVQAGPAALGLTFRGLFGVWRQDAVADTPGAGSSAAVRPGRLALAVLGLTLAGAQAALALPYAPVYLDAYNPLAGGIAMARHVLLVGWGEGLPEAARFLNARPDAATEGVAAWYGQNVFGPYYQGRSYDLYYEARTAADLYARDVDHVVTYVNEVQRGLVDASVSGLLGRPLYVVTSGSVTLAEVYSWPKPFAHTADRELTAGLRLQGWTIGAHDLPHGTLTVFLYWDPAALAAAARSVPPIVAWLKDSAGVAWSTMQAPVSPHERQVPGWLNHPAIEQQIVLPIPAGLLAGNYTVEMAPLEGRGATLGTAQVLATRASLDASLPGGMQPIPVSLTFDSNIRLAGYKLTQDGARIAIDLLWTAATLPAEEYKVFVHLVGTDDHIAAQFDGMLALPAAGSQKAADMRFQPGDLVRQPVQLELPAHSTGAGYAVYVGLYDPISGARLPLTIDGSPSPEGRYRLAAIPAP